MGYSIGRQVAKALDSFCTTIGNVVAVRVDLPANLCECDVVIYAYDTPVTAQLVSGGGWGQAVISVPQIGTEVEVSFLNGRASAPYVTKVKAPDYIMIDMELVQARIGRDDVQMVVRNEQGTIMGQVTIGQNGIIFNEDGLPLVTQLVQKLNDFVNTVNSNSSTFNSHTHSNGNNGSPTGGPIASSMNNATRFDVNGIGNTKK
jgi:hypothetical protein